MNLIDILREQESEIEVDLRFAAQRYKIHHGTLAAMAKDVSEAIEWDRGNTNKRSDYYFSEIPNGNELLRLNKRLKTFLSVKNTVELMTQIESGADIWGNA